MASNHPIIAKLISHFYYSEPLCYVLSFLFYLKLKAVETVSNNTYNTNLKCQLDIYCINNLHL